MLYRLGRDSRSPLLVTQFRYRAPAPVVLDIEADDPCLLLDAPAANDDDGIVSCPFDVVLVDMQDALLAA